MPPIAVPKAVARIVRIVIFPCPQVMAALFLTPLLATHIAPPHIIIIHACSLTLCRPIGWSLYPRKVVIYLCSALCFCMCTAQGFAFLGAALVSYLITLLDGASHRIGSGDRCWPWLQKLDVWRRISLFLFGPQSILCSESDTKAVESCVQAIVAAHPHGIMSWNHTMMFTNCAGRHIAPVDAEVDDGTCVQGTWIAFRTCVASAGVTSGPRWSS